MKKLYIKANRYYKKMFQTITTIYESDGKRFVSKEPANQEAVGHIKNMYEGRNIQYKNLTLCPCDYKDGKLWFPYIKGEPLKNKYLKALENADKDAFYQLLDFQMKLLEFYDENYGPFKKTETFSEIFGDADGLNECISVKKCSFDCTANNIILQEDGEKVFIDYEWCFDFPIPYDLLKYHCIFSLYMTNAAFEEFVPSKEVFQHLDFKLEEELLHKLHQNFIYYIDREDPQKISSFEARKNYLKRAIELVPLNEKDIIESLNWHIKKLQETFSALEGYQKSDIQKSEQISELMTALEGYRKSDIQKSEQIGELIKAVEGYRENDIKKSEQISELMASLEGYRENDIKKSEQISELVASLEGYQQNDIKKSEQISELVASLEGYQQSDIKKSEQVNELMKAVEWYKENDKATAQHIEELNQSLEGYIASDTIKTQQVNEQQAYIKELEESVNWHIAKVKELDAGIKWHLEEEERKDKELEALKEKFNAAQQQIFDMESSFSWKITKFLRRN